MDLSRYAARLGSAQESAPKFIRNPQAGDESLRTPERFGPSSVAFTMLPAEPEDAVLTGGTRSLSRRLLGLNIAGRVERPGTYRKRIDGNAA